MKSDMVKRIVQILLALSGIAGIIYVSPILAVPLRVQFGWSAQSILVLEGVLAVLAGDRLADCDPDSVVCGISDKTSRRKVTENVHAGFTEWCHWFNHRTYSSIFYWKCLVRVTDHRRLYADSDVPSLWVSGYQSGHS